MRHKGKFIIFCYLSFLLISVSVYSDQSFAKVMYTPRTEVTTLSIESYYKSISENEELSAEVSDSLKMLRIAQKVFNLKSF